MQEEPLVPFDEEEAPRPTSTIIPEFPELTRYFEERKPEYNDAHAPEHRLERPPPNVYSARSPLEVEEIVADKEKDEELIAFKRDMKELDDLVASPSTKKASLIGRLLNDFQLWRQNRPKRHYVELKTQGQLQKLLHDSRNENADLPFSPAYIRENTGELASLITHFASSEQLVRAGLRNLSAHDLAEQGLLISNLRTYHRAPAEMAKFFTSFDNLCDAGFTKYQFDSRLWSLNAFASAYSLEPVIIAAKCEMGAADLLYAGVKPADLPAYGITAEHIVTQKSPFEIFHALRMDPLELHQQFAFHPNHLFIDGKRPLMNNVQLCILLHHCDWKLSKLREIGCTTEQFMALGMMPKLDLRLRMPTKN